MKINQVMAAKLVDAKLFTGSGIKDLPVPYMSKAIYGQLNSRDAMEGFRRRLYPVRRILANEHGVATITVTQKVLSRYLDEPVPRVLTPGCIPLNRYSAVAGLRFYPTGTRDELFEEWTKLKEAKCVKAAVTSGAGLRALTDTGEHLSEDASDAYVTLVTRMLGLLAADPLALEAAA